MINKLRILKSKIRGNIFNARGWKTGRKLLIIESDDWGSIRMPSKEVYNKFIDKGFDVKHSLYNRLDSLASEDDLHALFNVLNSFQDKKGNPLVITANTVVANPDFEKIEKSNFQNYEYELFTETLKKYPNHVNAFSLWKEGIDKKLFTPQFHAREHLNVALWMQALQSNIEVIRYAFKNQTTYSGKSDYSFMDAFDFEKEEELESLKIILKDGLDLFEKIFGFRSKSFIAPCYIWHPEVEQTLKESGVEYFQGMRHQLIPTEEHFKYRKVKHNMGDINTYGQYYLIRNATFEPSSIEGMDWVNYCFNQIETAFAWNKPAIITSHRVNYIGFLDKNNRDRSLELLTTLIQKVQKKWPEVEFLSSDQLGDMIKGSKNA